MLLSAQPVVYGCEKKPIVTPSKVKVFNEKYSVFRFEEQVSLDSWGEGLFYRVNVYAVKLGNDYLLIDSGHETLFKDLCSKLYETFHKMPIAVLITHGHADHAGAGSEFLALNIPVYAPQGDDWMMETGLQGLYPPGFTYTPFTPKYFNPGDVLFGLVVLASPGHTFGSVSFFDRSSKRLFSSDTTMIRQNDLSDPYFDVTYQVQYQTLLQTPQNLREMQLSSLETLKTLKSIAIYPGHGIPYYQWREVSQFIEESILLVQSTLPP